MADSEDKTVTEAAAKTAQFEELENLFDEPEDDPVKDGKTDNESKSKEEDSVPNETESESKEKASVPNGTESESKDDGSVPKEAGNGLENENEKEKEVVEVMETEEESKTKSVTGVVFQFDEKSILFEFSLRTFEGGKINLEEDLIGEISPQKLVCKGSAIPKGTKSDQIAKYVQSGDEIRCQVEKKDDLKVFTYIEEEEEIGEDGEVTQSTRTVKLKPNYSASSGKLVSDSAVSGDKDSDKLNKDDLLVLEDQLENLFDYEPDEPEDDDDEIAFIEEVKVDPEIAKKKKEEKEAAAKKEAAKKSSSQNCTICNQIS